MKLLLILLCFICFNVDALTYYSEYNDYKESSEKEEESDIKEVIKVKKYKYYHETVNKEYFMEGENTIEYPYISDNKKEEVYDTLELPNTKQGRKIEEKIKYKYYYKNDSKIRYIKFENKLNNKIDCRTLIIKNLNTTIDFDMEEENNIIYIDLKDYYDHNNIRMIVTFYDTMDLYMYFLNGIEDSLYYVRHRFEKNDRQISYSINYNSVIPFKSLDYEYKLHDTDILDDTMELVEEINYYQVTDTYIEYYNMNKEYSDYLEQPTTYFDKRDTSDYIEVYKYRTRDKLEIEDELIIYDINTNLNNLIKYSTDKVDINTNLIDKSGVYDIVFKLNDITVKKKLVYFKNNDLENERIKNLLNNYNNVINDQYNIISKKDSIIDELNLKNNDLIKTYENKIFNLNTRISFNNKNNNDKYIYTLIILIVILLIYIIYLIIRYKKKIKKLTTYVESDELNNKKY